MKTNKPSDLTFHEIVSHLANPPLEGEWVDTDRPQGPPITHKQRRQLSREIRQASIYVGPQECAEQAIYNRLRVVFRIEHIEALPAAEFDVALLLVRGLHDIAMEWLHFRYQLEQAFIRDHLGGSVPWTPHVSREWRKRLKEAIPIRPDWQAMAEQLGLPRKKPEDN